MGSNINKKVGENIRKYRLKRNMSQEELGFEADLHRAYIGHVERGERSLNMNKLEKIAKALRIPPSKLINL